MGPSNSRKGSSHRECAWVVAFVGAAMAIRELRWRDEGPKVVRFPFALPRRFAEMVGYGGFRHIVGMYRGHIWGDLAVYDADTLWSGVYDTDRWALVLETAGARHWLNEHYVDLGAARRPATHHLVIDRDANEAFVTDPVRARRIVRTQRFESEDFL